MFREGRRRSAATQAANKIKHQVEEELMWSKEDEECSTKTGYSAWNSFMSDDGETQLDNSSASAYDGVIDEAPEATERPPNHNPPLPYANVNFEERLKELRKKKSRRHEHQRRRAARQVHSHRTLYLSRRMRSKMYKSSLSLGFSPLRPCSLDLTTSVIVVKRSRRSAPW
jgi:hypothetical protein